MSSFTDAFGVPQRPAVLLARKRSKITREAMASFRDLIVLSVVPYNRAQLIGYGKGSHRILFSNSFWLYPWMLDKNYEWLITQSLASLGLPMDYRGDIYLCCAMPLVPSFRIGPYLALSADEILERRYMHAFCPSCNAPRRVATASDKDRIGKIHVALA
jgi:hypothetical protein